MCESNLGHVCATAAELVRLQMERDMALLMHIDGPGNLEETVEHATRVSVGIFGVDNRSLMYLTTAYAMAA
jgi:indole-3-glycerol phosphate synthase